jgi:hypothetical protein
MTALVHPLKRKKPGRKKGPPTNTITIRVSKDHKEAFDALWPGPERRPWLEKLIDRRNGKKGGRPKKNPNPTIDED